jgi:hypothetical protein
VIEAMDLSIAKEVILMEIGLPNESAKRAIENWPIRLAN